jgi:putative PIN family toxin of toxin-antitoxin system
MIQAAVDPALLVRGLLSPAGGNDFIIQALRERRFILFTSEELLGNVARLLGYPGLQRKYNLTEAARRDLVAQLKARASVVAPAGKLDLFPNPHDNHLLEVAFYSHAEYVVTENDALHEDAALTWFLIERSTRAIRLAEFARILRDKA